MDIQSAKRVIVAASKVDDTVIMEGVHGIGKSDILKQFAKEENYHLETLFLSQQEVGDLIGIPNITEVDGNMLTTWSVPIWLQRMREAAAEGKHCVLFLDELNRAPIDVRQSALQLVLERQIHEHLLPEVDGQRTLVVAAINPADTNYQTDELDPALLDRFLHITVDVDVKAWLNWARENKINQVVQDFIIDNPKFLHFTPNEGFGSTPRSWSKLASYIDIIDDIPADILTPIIKGKIGAENSGLFFSFLKNYVNVVTVEDIEAVVSDNSDKTDNIEEIAKIIRQLVVKSEAPQKIELAHRLGDKYLGQDSLVLLAYLYAMEPEICISFLKRIKAEDPQGYVKLAALDGVVNDTQLFVRILTNAETEG